MRVLVTGATGFIGRALLLRLRRDGHDITAWVRSAGRARDLLGDDVTIVSEQDDGLARAIAQADAVVNLAGESIFGRWTAARKQAIHRSRVDLTERIVQAFAEWSARPRVLISGSAIGYYGDSGSDPVCEASAPGDDFLARVCVEWEEAARQAESAGTRVVLLRSGIVLGRGGGALRKMLPIFRLGLGGRLGSGAQWVSWIHLHDHVEVVATALRDERYRGPINLTAPNPVTNLELTASLGDAVKHASPLAVPPFFLKMAMGEAAHVLLGGQRALPQRLSELGFVHRFPTIHAALAHIVDRSVVTIEPVGKETALPTDERTAYFSTRRPLYCLVAKEIVDGPSGNVFEFFSHARNLGPMTPAHRKLRMGQGVADPVTQGTVIEQTIKLGPVSVPWRARIERFDAPRRFIDSQERGPYRSWWHEHDFEPRGEKTAIEDRVYYSPPFGIVGRIAHRLFITQMLEDAFGFRRDAVRLRFGHDA